EPDELFEAIASGDDERAFAMMETSPALIRARHHLLGWTPLHIAARALNAPVVEWLLDRGADPNARGRHDFTPLDMAAHFSGDEPVEKVAALLLGRGAGMTGAAAVALEDADWLRRCQREGALINPIEDSGGLLRIAASHNRPE